jgi:hypothetical protein
VWAIKFKITQKILTKVIIFKVEGFVVEEEHSEIYEVKN